MALAYKKINIYFHWPNRKMKVIYKMKIASDLTLFAQIKLQK